MFSKEATKKEKIFTVNLTVKSKEKISSIIVAFLENMNFTKTCNEPGKCDLKILEFVNKSGKSRQALGPASKE